MEKDYCVVIGGVNVDIGGKPDAPLIPRDSNPGRIIISLGGVGRNIAHNMTLLGLKVKLITAIGDDDNGKKIIDSCNELGIDIEGYCKCPDDATSSYLFIANNNGDMSVAISDMNIYKNITPEYLEKRLPEINKAKLVVVDTNIPTESIAFLTKKCKVPIFADPVSCTKAARLLPSLSGLYAVTPNALETRILTGIKVEASEDETLEKAVKVFLDAGVKNVALTLGEDGLYIADKKNGFHVRNLPCKLVNATGAGDAMMAGFAYAYIKEMSLKETALVGLAAASIACESTTTINENLNIESVLKRAGLM